MQEQVREWQSRPLDAVYPILYLDALRVKVRVDGAVQNRCIYLAIGVDLNGKKQALGLWSAESEGAKLWLSVLTELQNRGVADVLIVCVDGLKGFSASHRIGFSARDGSSLHRSPNQKQLIFRVV